MKFIICDGRELMGLCGASQRLVADGKLVVVEETAFADFCEAADGAGAKAAAVPAPHRSDSPPSLPAAAHRLRACRGAGRAAATRRAAFQCTSMVSRPLTTEQRTLASASSQ